MKYSKVYINEQQCIILHCSLGINSIVNNIILHYRILRKTIKLTRNYNKISYSLVQCTVTD